MPSSAASVRECPLVLPTYALGAPEINPLFYSGQGYQGAKRTVYPYPFLDKLSDAKVDKTYKAVCLENEYLQVTVLPELGGRIFAGLDKTDGYDFFYRQRVIKPALIGMLGAWISGGVEWDLPHHHRATTFMPVDYRLEEHADGGRTVVGRRGRAQASHEVDRGHDRVSGPVIPRSDPEDVQPHAPGAFDALLHQRGCAREPGLPRDLPAGDRVRRSAWKA